MKIKKESKTPQLSDLGMQLAGVQDSQPREGLVDGKIMELHQKLHQKTNEKLDGLVVRLVGICVGGVLKDYSGVKI
jgi:hypothetical protein